MDIKRIPILSLSSIISLTEFLGELPLPHVQPEPSSDSLWHNEEVYNEATRILNSKNKGFFESLTKALSSTSTEEIVLKDNYNDEKTGVEGVPTIFKLMVKCDSDQFRNIVGFEQFFKVDEKKKNAIQKPKDKSKKKKKKTKSEKEKSSSNSAANKSGVLESSYTVASRVNGTRLTIKKLKPDPIVSPECVTSTQTSLQNLIISPSKPVESNGSTNTAPIKESVKQEENTNTKSESIIKNESVNEKLKNENLQKLQSLENLSKSGDTNTGKDDNYSQFLSLPLKTTVTLESHQQPSLFDTNKLFETEVNLDNGQPKMSSSELLIDTSNSSVINDPSAVGSRDVKDSLLLGGLGSEITATGNAVDAHNSPIPDEDNNEQHFGLAGYLTKFDNNETANTNTTTTTTSTTNNNSNQNNMNSSLNQETSNMQPGSCVSLGQNSVDKTSDAASILDSTQFNGGGPNSALSSTFEHVGGNYADSSGHYGHYNRKQRCRNKEVENLKKWQIKDKTIPHNDPLEWTAVGPGERVKTRTRRCVRRTDREDGSSISETSYQTANDVSPHTQDLIPIAQSSSFTNLHSTNHQPQFSVKSSESSIDENKQSPFVATSNNATVTIALPYTPLSSSTTHTNQPHHQPQLPNDDSAQVIQDTMNDHANIQGCNADDGDDDGDEDGVGRQYNHHEEAIDLHHSSQEILSKYLITDNDDECPGDVVTNEEEHDPVDLLFNNNISVVDTVITTAEPVQDKVLCDSPQMEESMPFPSPINNVPTTNSNINNPNSNINNNCGSVVSRNSNVFTPNFNSSCNNNIKGKKIPPRTRNRISSRASSLENYSNYEVSSSVLKAEVIDDMSDDSIHQFNDLKPKSNKTTKKKTKKAKKVTSFKSSSVTDSRLQHLLASRESQNYTRNRQRVLPSFQYNKNMDPVVLIQPLNARDFETCDSDGNIRLSYNRYDDDNDDAASSASTIPFNFHTDDELILYFNDVNNGLCDMDSAKRRCDTLKMRFSHFLDILLNNVEELDLCMMANRNKLFCASKEYDDDGGGVDLKSASLPKESLDKLNDYVGKLKKNQIMHEVPAGKLVRLLMVLLVNMSSCKRVPNENKKRIQRFLQQQLLDCLDASLIALSIIVSPDMSRTVFLEDIIQNATDLFNTILRFIIYIVHDHHYSRTASPHDLLLVVIANININKSFSQSEHLVHIQERVQCGINCLAEILLQKPNRLTDEAVLKITNLATSSFSVSNITELQLSLIPLLATVFNQYEPVRKSIVTDLLSIFTHNNHNASSSKKVVRKYKINSEESIQMISAVILILFQSVVQKPNISNKKSNNANKSNHLTADNNNNNSTVSSSDNLILSTLNSSVKYMQTFVLSFFKKVCLKGEDSCRQSLDNFLQDLFVTFNKPEWPAANFLLHCFGSTILQHLSEKNPLFPNSHNNTNARSISIDLLGTITGFLAKENARMKPANSITEAQNLLTKLVDDIISNLCVNSQLSDDKIQEIEALDTLEKLRLMKLITINYLTVDSSDTTIFYTRRHFIGLCLQELYMTNSPNRSIDEKDNSNEVQSVNAQLTKQDEKFKALITTQLASKTSHVDTMDLDDISYEDVCQICRVCQFHKDVQNFEAYLTRICKSLDENSVPVRTKALRSLSLVLEEDSSLLTKGNIENAVNKRFLDSSIAVREATVDLVGKYLLKKPDLVNQYYPVLITRIADTGTSVRKRVIKVLWDICSAQPDFPNAPDAYSKIMRRFYDEESIKKQVNEVFKSIWFVPISDPVKLQQRIFSIANVIQCISADEKYNHNVMFQFISQLVKIECEHNQDLKAQRSFEKSLQQIIESLVQTVIRLQEVSSGHTQDNHKGQNQKKLCSIWNALHIFAKVRPKLVWPHLSDLSQLLKQVRNSGSSSSSTTSSTTVNSSCTDNSSYNTSNNANSNIGSNLKQTLGLNNDMAICMNHLCGTLNAGLAATHGCALEHKGIELTQDNLCGIANDLITLAVNAPKKFIVDSAIKCLFRVTNFTKEYSGVQTIFAKSYYKVLNLTDQLKACHYNHHSSSREIDVKRNTLFRMSYTAVVLCRYFDMNNVLNKELTFDEVFSKLLDITIYFAKFEVKDRMISNMNHLVHKKRDLLVEGPIHDFYINSLSLVNNDAGRHLSSESCKTVSLVLENISNFLKHNELRMMQETSTWKSKGALESLKEVQDVEGSFGNVIAQRYVDLVLDCCLVDRTEVRMAALNFITKILSQGLVQPLRCVAHLIALQGDVDNIIKFKADSQLNELNNKYPNYLTMKAQLGMKLSYRLQNSIFLYLNRGNPSVAAHKHVRGWICSTNASSINGSSIAGTANFHAINHQLYNLLRKHKSNWRCFLTGMASLYESSQKLDMKELLFYTDQLSSFPYQIQEEPLLLIHKLDLIISVDGQTLLRKVRETIKKLVSKQHADRVYKDGELSDLEMSHIVKSLMMMTTNTMMMNESLENEVGDALENGRLRLYNEAMVSRRVMLMCCLRRYLSKIYGISDNKIMNYGQNQSCKGWDKPVCRSVNAVVFEIPVVCSKDAPDDQVLLSCNSSKQLSMACSELLIMVLKEILDFRKCWLSVGTDSSTVDVPTTQPEPSLHPPVTKHNEHHENHQPHHQKKKKQYEQADVTTKCENSHKKSVEKNHLKRGYSEDNGKKHHTVPHSKSHQPIIEPPLSSNQRRGSASSSSRQTPIKVASKRPPTNVTSTCTPIINSTRLPSPIPALSSHSSSLSSLSTLADDDQDADNSNKQQQDLSHFQHHKPKLKHVRRHIDDDDEEYVPENKRRKTSNHKPSHSSRSTSKTKKRKYPVADKEIPQGILGGSTPSVKNTPKNNSSDKQSSLSNTPKHHQNHHHHHNQHQHYKQSTTPITSSTNKQRPQSDTKYDKSHVPSSKKSSHHHHHQPKLTLTSLPSDFLGSTNSVPAPNSSTNKSSTTTTPAASSTLKHHPSSSSTATEPQRTTNTNHKQSFKHSVNLFAASNSSNNHHSHHNQHRQNSQQPPTRKALFKSSVKTMPNSNHHHHIKEQQHHHHHHKRGAPSPIRPIKKSKKKRRFICTSSDSDENWESEVS